MGNKQTQAAATEVATTDAKQVALDEQAAKEAAEKKAEEKRIAEWAAAAAVAGDTTWLTRSPENTPVPGGGSWNWNAETRVWDDNLPQAEPTTVTE